VRFMKLGRCGLLRESFPKKLDWRRPLPQSSRFNVSESSIRGRLPAGCFSKRVLLREYGFCIHTSPLNAVKPVGVALTSNAAQVAGLGRIYFVVFRHAFFANSPGSRRLPLSRRRLPPYSYLIIRFLFSYTDHARMPPKKFFGFPVFRGCRRTSTSASRLVSASRCKTDFIFR
jgi:hypothetical protein